MSEPIKRTEFSLVLEGDDGNAFRAVFSPIQGGKFHLRIYSNGEEKASYWPLSGDSAIELVSAHIVPALKEVLKEFG